MKNNFKAQIFTINGEDFETGKAYPESDHIGVYQLKPFRKRLFTYRDVNNSHDPLHTIMTYLMGLKDGGSFKAEQIRNMLEIG